MLRWVKMLYQANEHTLNFGEMDDKYEATKIWQLE